MIVSNLPEFVEYFLCMDYMAFSTICYFLRIPSQESEKIKQVTCDSSSLHSTNKKFKLIKEVCIAAFPYAKPNKKKSNQIYVIGKHAGKLSNKRKYEFSHFPIKLRNLQHFKWLLVPFYWQFSIFRIFFPCYTRVPKG